VTKAHTFALSIYHLDIFKKTHYWIIRDYWINM